MTFFVHPQAICESADVGEGTRIWAFAHVLAGARIGTDCNVGDHAYIENDVIVGDRVTVKNGVQLWDGLRVGDDVFIGPNATFTNDRFPRSKVYGHEIAVTRVEEGASIGANATILPGLTIGSRAMVGAGSVVTHDVPPEAIVAGPAARSRDTDETQAVSAAPGRTPEERPPQPVPRPARLPPRRALPPTQVLR